MASGVLVLVSSSYPEAADGTEAAGSFVADLAEALSRRIRVRVVAPGMGEAVEHVNANLDVYRFRAPAKPLSTLRWYSIADAIQIIRVLRGGHNTTIAAAGAGEVKHILALWALPCGHWARSASVTFGIPYSVWTLGSDIWSLGKIPVIRQILARVLRQAVHCYSDGYLLRDDTQRIGDRPTAFLPSTRNIESDPDKVMSSAPPYRLVFIGRWHQNKGPDMLLRALALLEDTTWQKIASVDIYGGGPLRPLLEAALEHLQARKRPVNLHGFIDKNAARAVLQRADFLLIPSRVESIPVVFSDAMKMRCPVIANPVGDLTVLVGEGPVGVIATAINSKAYAAAIRAALDTVPAEYGQALDAMATRFSLGESLVPRIIADLAMDKA